jgi:hypothetical protein
LPSIGFFGVATLLIWFKVSLRAWERWFLGERGESRVTETLKSLPDDYVVLNDLVLPDSKGNIDHLLIGPNGVFAIETKNYSGYVKCEEEHWFVNGRRIHSLSKQAKRNSMAVRGCIANLFTSPQNKVPYIIPLLVFVNSRIKIKLSTPTVPVLKLAELVPYIRNYSSDNYDRFKYQQGPHLSLAPELMRAMIHHLQMLQRNFAYLSD